MSRLAIGILAACAVLGVARAVRDAGSAREHREGAIPRLERLRLNREGKPQVDVVNGRAAGSARELAVRFETSRGSETVRLGGWTAVPIRRTATISRPQPCGSRERVVATLERPSPAGLPALAGYLVRHCEGEAQR